MTRRAIRRYRFISFTIFLPFQLVWLRCRINKYIQKKEVPLQFNVNESNNTLTISKICETRLEILNKNTMSEYIQKKLSLEISSDIGYSVKITALVIRTITTHSKARRIDRVMVKTLDSKSLGSRFKFSHCLVDFPILMTL